MLEKEVLLKKKHFATNEVNWQHVSRRVTAPVELPDVCILLLGHTPSSRPQETALCTGRQTRAARGSHSYSISHADVTNSSFYYNRPHSRPVCLMGRTKSLLQLTVTPHYPPTFAPLYHFVCWCICLLSVTVCCEAVKSRTRELN